MEPTKHEPNANAHPCKGGVSVSLLEEFANYILHNANWSESFSENPWYSENLDKEVTSRELAEVFLNSR